ncbi:MAG: tryptophan synthase subunit alpha [Pirellulaceae bacterium]|nr:tryptophan synthase subunit alpha [Pirellulaceae bacterium]
MSRIDDRFHELKAAGRKAFIPFLTAGDPDLDFTAQALKALDEEGATFCEIGIPYSDPIADGPVIQASYSRALDQKIKLDNIFAMTATIGQEIQAPLITMVSYAIIYKRGLKQYIQDAQKSGIDGAIVPDLPVEEAGPFSALCKEADFSLIQLITPTTPADRVEKILATTSGFLYYVSVTGITGERKTLPTDLADRVKRLQEKTTLPICVGFGIHQPEHVKTVSAVADGVIVGSAFVKRVATAKTDPTAALTDIREYTQRMVAGLSSK